MINLSHTVLYAKGHYKENDLIEDLKITLEADNYSPFNIKNIASILLRHCEKELKTHHQFRNFGELLDGIHPDNIWKVSYPSTIDYNQDLAIIYYCLSAFRFLDVNEWKVIPPSNKVLKTTRSNKVIKEQFKGITDTPKITEECGFLNKKK